MSQSRQSSTLISCFAAYGSGGLGQHFTQVIEEARSQARLLKYYSFGTKPDDPSGQRIKQTVTRYLDYTPLRYSPGWTSFLECDAFDRAVAAKTIPTEEFHGFVGQSLHSFQAVRQAGCQFLRLEAANSHVNNVVKQHQKATQKFGVESSWLNEAQRRKTLKEYEMADVIYVASEYTRQSFLAEGIPDSKLRQIELKPRPRFVSSGNRSHDGIFRIVYVGSLTVMKGIPILLEAFSRLPGKDVHLTLVGGWATRGMRRYLQAWLSRDSRIQIAPGDPLPHLQRANVYVHPTYEDGFAYAPMEALACGIPVIVTEDTGMKEHIQTGFNGHVIPTGDWEALLEKLGAYKSSSLTLSSQ